MDKWQPLQLAFLEELADIERALVEEVHVGGAIIGIVGAVGDEFVDVVKALVVAAIATTRPSLFRIGRRSLMLEAAEGGPLYRDELALYGSISTIQPNRFGSLGSFSTLKRSWYFHHAYRCPSDPVALVGRGLRHFSARRRSRVDVLFADENRAPGRPAAGAIVRGADNCSAGGSALVFKGRAPRPGRRPASWCVTAKFADCVGCRSRRCQAPPAGSDLDNSCGRARPSRPRPGPWRFASSYLLGEARKHQLRAGVFVIDAEKPVLRIRSSRQAAAYRR